MPLPECEFLYIDPIKQGLKPADFGVIKVFG